MMKMELAYVVENFTSNLYPYDVEVLCRDTDTGDVTREVEGMFETYSSAIDFALETNAQILAVKGDIALYYATFA